MSQLKNLTGAFSLRQTLYFTMQQKCFNGTFHFIVQNIKKMYTQGFRKLIMFTTSLRTFLSKTGFKVIYLFKYLFIYSKKVTVKTTVAISMVWCHCPGLC